MNSKHLIILLRASAIAIACVSTMTSAGAVTVYKSIGSFGEVKYSQFKPTDSSSSYEVIELRSDGRQADTGEMNGKVDANEEEPPTPEEQRIAQLEAQMKEQKEKETAQRCQALRNNLTNLNTGGRIFKPDGDGGRKFLDSREIELERKKIQNLINEHCNG